MKILVRNQEKGNWKVVESAKYSAEAELQRLLSETPSLIPIQEIREDVSPLAVAIREFGLPGSGTTDLLAFTQDGDIAIVECKLDANAESKRKVVGQILEYGAFLWGTTYQQVDDRVSKLANRNLATLVAESVEGGEWDEEAFRANVERNLKSGAFMLIIAVDAISEDLSKIIQFLNGCGKPAFTFHALEMERFRNADTEVLVPHLHGTPKDGPPPPGPKQRFLDAIAKLKPELEKTMSDLHQWATTESGADEMTYGKGIVPAFTLRHFGQGKRARSFIVRSDGIVEFWQKYLAAEFGQDLVLKLRETMSDLPSIKSKPLDSAAVVFIDVGNELAGRAETIHRFKNAVAEMGKAVHAQ